MNQHLGHITFLVKEYDESLDFFIGKLKFTLVEDIPMPGNKRWLVVSPRGQGHCSLLLAKANGPEQEQQIGRQAGGRVFLFLYTDQFLRDYNQMQKEGIVFLEEPRKEAYGTVAVFRDLYGNKWDLIQPAKNGGR